MEGVGRGYDRGMICLLRSTGRPFIHERPFVQYRGPYRKFLERCSWVEHVMGGGRMWWGWPRWQGRLWDIDRLLTPGST